MKNAEKIKNAAYRYAKKVFKEYQCRECGKLFSPKIGDSRRVFCSKICAGKHKARSNGGGLKRKARKYNVPYEFINKQKVFERDGWRCQICGKATPQKNCGTRYANAPELDHRIPIANGGPHLYSNVQCSCHACNREKSNHNEAGQFTLLGIRIGRDYPKGKKILSKTDVNICEFIPTQEKETL